MIRNEIQKIPAQSENIFGIVKESKIKGKAIKEVTATVVKIMDKGDTCHFGLKMGVSPLLLSVAMPRL